MSGQMIYRGAIADDLRTLRLQDFNKQIADKVHGRTTYFVQWALAEAGHYTDPVDGNYRLSTMTAFNNLLGANYGGQVGKYKPVTGQAASLDAFRDILWDYGIGQDPTGQYPDDGTGSVVPLRLTTA